MNIHVEGVVLRSVDYKESDKILTVLTRDRGNLTVKASGARRRGSRLASGTQLFCYSEMTLYEHGGRYALDECDVRAQFYGLSRDLEKMTLASYLAQVLLTQPEDAPQSGDVLRLTLNSFYALEQGRYLPAAVKAAFELRYMALCGYAPDLSACARCGGELSTGGYIDLRSGQMCCARCAGPLAGALFLDGPALRAARYILGCDLRRLFSFRLPPASQAALSAFCEGYLLEKTEQGYKTLDLYKSLFGREELNDEQQ